MVNRIRPTKTCTLYELYPEYNTGMDELCEITKTIVASSASPDGYEKFNSRMMLMFNNSDIIQAGSGSGYRYYLRIFEAEHKEIPEQYSLLFHAVSSSWERGSGRFSDYPNPKDGAGWYYRDGAINATSWRSPGGDYYTASAVSQSFNSQTTQDIFCNVTPLVNQWMRGTIVNNGLMVKLSSGSEDDLRSAGILQYFSATSDTIYKPYLEVHWNDAQFVTGSLIVAPDDINVSIKNLKANYYRTETPKLRLMVSPRWQPKSFTAATAIYNPGNTYYITGSQYAIIDFHTGEHTIEWDDFSTGISCDSTGNYFNLCMNALETGRFYAIAIRQTDSDGNITVYQNDALFEVL